MPELPDVQVLKQYLDATSLHQEIRDVQVHSDRILIEITPQALKQGLKGRTFEATRRHGKYLFVALDDARWLMLHFGMTGDLQYFKDQDQTPEYVQLRFDFVNGYHLAYTMPRKLGRVRMLEDMDDLIAEKELGPDALGLDWETFQKALQGRRAMTKSALMNQEIIAGIGNVYSDEILFQARVHPRVPVNELDSEKLRALFDKIGAVLQTAIERRAEPEQFPDTYLIPRRQDGETCPACGGEVEKIKVSGRSGYYCPHCQER